MVFNPWLWLHKIYVNITNVLSDLPVVLYQLSRSIHDNSPIMWWEMSRKNNSFMSSTSSIVYWDEQRRMFHLSSCLFKYFFTQARSYSFPYRNIYFSVPIGLCMTGPEGFHCHGIYTFIQRTICFEQIEYQPWHLSGTQISNDDRDTRKKDFSLQ